MATALSTHPNTSGAPKTLPPSLPLRLTLSVLTGGHRRVTAQNGCALVGMGRFPHTALKLRLNHATPTHTLSGPLTQNEVASDRSLTPRPPHLHLDTGT